MTGLEPATSGVTGQCSNQLRYIPMVGVGGIEPPTSRSRTVRATRLRYTPLLWPVAEPTSCTSSEELSTSPGRKAATLCSGGMALARDTWPGLPIERRTLSCRPPMKSVGREGIEPSSAD